MDLKWVIRTCAVAWMAAPGLTLPEFGGVEGDFITWGAGVRALGMGRAFVAMADDASAGLWNPAGLAQLQQTELTGLHALLWEGATYSFASVAFPTLTQGTFGLSGTMLQVGGFERRDEMNEVVGDAFGSLKTAVVASYGFSLSPQWHVGAAVKYIGRWLDGWHSGFVSGDLGVLVSPFAWVTVGAAARNVSSYRYNTVDDLPQHIQVGMAFKGWEEAVITTAALEGNGRWNVGMELRATAPLFFRMGTTPWESMAGVGLQWGGTTLDYSGAIHRELGASHRIALSLRLGEQLSLTREELAKQYFQQAFEAFQHGEKVLADRLLAEVLALDTQHLSAAYLKMRVAELPDKKR